MCSYFKKKKLSFFKVKIIAIQAQVKFSRIIMGLFYAFLCGKNDQKGYSTILIYSKLKILFSYYFNNIFFSYSEDLFVLLSLHLSRENKKKSVISGNLTVRLTLF